MVVIPEDQVFEVNDYVVSLQDCCAADLSVLGSWLLGGTRAVLAPALP